MTRSKEPYALKHFKVLNNIVIKNNKTLGCAVWLREFIYLASVVLALFLSFFFLKMLFIYLEREKVGRKKGRESLM